MDFDRALAFTLKWEGGYVNHPNDPGGETYRGISRRAHPRWPGWATLEQMMPVHGSRYPELEPLVAEFYRTHYWDRVKGDDLPALVAVSVFDHAVHSGVPRASRALQRKVGAKVDAVMHKAPAPTGEVRPTACKDLFASVVAQIAS